MSKLELLAYVIGSLWTFFKTAGFFELRRLAHLERLFQALEIGVHAAWRDVVKPWIDSNPTTDPLPDDIKQAARTRAIDVATESDKVVRRFSNEVIQATIKAAVEDAKRRGGK